MVKLAADRNPWAAPHGQKSHAWQSILQALRDKGLCQDTSATVLHTRIDQMVDYQEVCLYIPLSFVLTVE